MFTGDYDLTIDAVNAIVRLFQEMDDEMYARWREKRWRHFLPVDFAVISVSQTCNYCCIEIMNIYRKRSN